MGNTEVRSDRETEVVPPLSMTLVARRGVNIHAVYDSDASAQITVMTLGCAATSACCVRVLQSRLVEGAVARDGVVGRNVGFVG